MDVVTAAIRDARRTGHGIKRRFSPPKEEYLIVVSPERAKKTLGVTISANSDRSELRVSYSNKPAPNDDIFRHGTESRTEGGEIVSYRLTDFGLADGGTYRLETPLKDRFLMLAKSRDGDLSIWVEGADIQGAKTAPDKRRSYIDVYTQNGKAVGYRVNNFVGRANSAFLAAHFDIQFE